MSGGPESQRELSRYQGLQRFLRNTPGSVRSLLPGPESLAQCRRPDNVHRQGINPEQVVGALPDPLLLPTLKKLRWP